MNKKYNILDDIELIDGTKVTVILVSEYWLLVKFPDGKEKWIDINDIKK